MASLYTTQDELDFLSRLLNKNREAFLKYANLVLDGMRRWDRNIDVPRVEGRIHDLMGEIAKEKRAKRKAAA